MRDGTEAMRFSRRTDWNTEESELARAHRLRVQAGLPIADLTASNPTRCGFDYAAELLEALANPQALDYDPQPQAACAAREAVCRYYADHGVALEPEQIVLTTSTSEAYSFLFRLLCDPGSEILVPQPGYPLFDFLAVLDDVRLKAAPLVYDHGWQIDPEGFRRAITPETRAIVLVHPNNPTGHFTKPWEAEELARLCREFDLSLIVDEVFLDYGLLARAQQLCRGAGRRSGFRGERAEQDCRAAADEGGVDCGHRSGAGAGAGAAGGHCRYVSLHECAGPVRAAEVAGGAGGYPGADSSACDGQSGRAGPATGRLPVVQRLEVEGGWYAMLRIPALKPDEQTVLELLERGVWVHPGYFFGMAESGWLVVSLLGPEEEFSTGVTGLVNYFGTNPGDYGAGHRA